MGKKVKRNINYATTSEQAEFKKLIIVILGLLVFVGMVILLTRAYVTKDLFIKEEPELSQPGVVDYDTAIVGNMLTRPYNEYYVAIFDSEDQDYAVDMGLMVDKYIAKKEHKHVYIVDLNNKLNKDYYDPKKVNVKATSIKDLKVGDITLLKVKKGKIDKYIVDFSKMQKELDVTK